MMGYLRNYNLSDEQIESAEREIEACGVDIDIFKYKSEKIISILDMFTSMGVNNIYDIITTSPTMFCDTITSIKNRIDKYPDKHELARLLNEDAENLALVGLL